MTRRQTKDLARIPVNVQFDANGVDRHVFVAKRGYRVVGLTYRGRVVGSDGSAVSAVFRKCADATAPSAGTALHSVAIDLKGTVDTDQDIDLDPTKTHIPEGWSIAVDLTGTQTAVVGVATITLEPTGR